MIITEELLIKGMSINGAWSKKQFKLLKVNWPPKRGWKKEIIGTDIKKDRMDEFISLKDQHIS